ncbi:MAG: sensor histidine kinase [Proteobacteria bacterium]|nr:sensor histidine kinase [Pseudomonadota bacterium]
MTDTASPQDRPVDAVMESNHRIGNHLATILALAHKEAAKLEAGADMVRREDAVAAIKGLACKVAAVSTLHRALLANGGRAEVDLARLLADTLRPLKELYGDRLRLDMSIGGGCAVTSEQAFVLALTFAEIVTNAVKYAHPSGLPVEMAVVGASTAGGSIKLEISDDGVGLPEGFNPDRDSGVGMKMVRYMIDSVGGELGTSSDELGLAFSITLPAKQSADRHDRPARP